MVKYVISRAQSTNYKKTYRQTDIFENSSYLQDAFYKLKEKHLILKAAQEVLNQY